jgi:deazaflavin-dependent oxidoreductase (nitroreductase family)
MLRSFERCITWRGHGRAKEGVMSRRVRLPGRAVRLAIVLGVVVGAARLAPGIAGDRRAAQGPLPEWRGPAWLRRFVTFRFDPLVTRLGLVGGRRSPWAMLEHVGRKSGTVYRTPILPYIASDHVLVPLPYGRGVQWLRNIQAAGHCRVQLHEEVLELDEPQVLTPGDVVELPDWRKRSLSGPMEFLRMRIFSRQPGRLAPVAPPDASEALGLGEAEPIGELAASS